MKYLFLIMLHLPGSKQYVNPLRRIACSSVCCPAVRRDEAWWDELNRVKIGRVRLDAKGTGIPCGSEIAK